jgi:hypothetical protein
VHVVPPGPLGNAPARLDGSVEKLDLPQVQQEVVEPMIRIITLDAQESELATRAGKARHAYHKDRGKELTCGFALNMDNQLAHIDACKSELALAILTDRVEQWVAFTKDFKSLPADVSDWLQVRCTRYDVDGQDAYALTEWNTNREVEPPSWEQKFSQ